ncbi:hypothetical protein EON65_58835 [archaeon]|nr:MAG: hypothetical protein EON65_58835 [archaeon]
MSSQMEMTKNTSFVCRIHNPIPLYVAKVKPVHYLSSMSRTSTRHYHRVGEVKRIHILTLKERGCTISQIAHQTIVKQRTVKALLHKWKQHHTIQDIPKTGRPSILQYESKVIEKLIFPSYFFFVALLSAILLNICLALLPSY